MPHQYFVQVLPTDIAQEIPPADIEQKDEIVRNMPLSCH